MNNSLRPSVLSALVVGFACFGDSFLYLVLPVYAHELNVPVIWIGFLLSINRFVRLFANQLFAYLFNKFGFRRITISVAFFATISTFLYGLQPGIIIWIIARVIWGVCYSALRISAASYSLENNRPGFSLGISSGLQELGPVIALLAGPLLLNWMELSTAFSIFSAASVSAIIIAVYLPEMKSTNQDYTFHFDIIPSLFNLLTFLLSFFIQGILIISLSKLLAEPGVSIAALTAATGFYLAYRRICTVFISPTGGLFADKLGMDKVFVTSLVFTIAGILLIASGLVKTGVFITFTFYCILNALAPAIASTGSHNQLKAVASNNTWSDMGAAAGVLLAGFLLDFASHSGIFFLATFILIAVGIIYIKSTTLKPQEFVK